VSYHSIKKIIFMLSAKKTHQELVHAITFKGGRSRELTKKSGVRNYYNHASVIAKETHLVAHALDLTTHQDNEGTDESKAISVIERRIVEEWTKHTDLFVEHLLGKVYESEPYGIFGVSRKEHIVKSSVLTVGAVGNREVDGIIKVFLKSVSGNGSREVAAYLCQSEESLDTVKAGRDAFFVDTDELCQEAFAARVPVVFARVKLLHTVMNSETNEVDDFHAMREMTRVAKHIATDIVHGVNILCENYLFFYPRWDLFSSEEFRVGYKRLSPVYNNNLFYMQGEKEIPQREEWISFEERKEWLSFLSRTKGCAENDYQRIMNAIRERDNRLSVNGLTACVLRHVDGRLSSTIMMEGRVFDYNVFYRHKWSASMSYPFNLLHSSHGGVNESFAMTTKEITLNRSWFRSMTFMRGDAVRVAKVCFLKVPEETSYDVEPALIGGVASSDDCEYWVKGPTAGIKDGLRHTHTRRRRVYIPIRISMIDDFWGSEVEVAWGGLIEMGDKQMSLRSVIAQLNYMGMKTRLILMTQSWERWTSFSAFISFLRKMMDVGDGAPHTAETASGHFFSADGLNKRMEWFTKYVSRVPEDETGWITKKKRLSQEHLTEPFLQKKRKMMMNIIVHQGAEGLNQEVRDELIAGKALVKYSEGNL